MIKCTDNDKVSKMNSMMHIYFIDTKLLIDIKNNGNIALKKK